MTDNKAMICDDDDMKVVSPATRDDVAAICQLTRAAQPDCIPLDPAAVSRSLERFDVIRRCGEVIATAALVPIGEGRGELRAVAVASQHRGCRLGSRLVQHILVRAWKQGLELHCVTRKPSYFRRHGFREVPRALVPENMRRRSEVDLPPRIFMVAAATKASTNDQHLRRAI